ncbi:MAG: DUF1549 domain-containing protein [Planctomycetaceae bacterium]|nr:DUF1549 domain-containing protein [Planctomycetaceae bacterium]
MPRLPHNSDIYRRIQSLIWCWIGLSLCNSVAVAQDDDFSPAQIEGFEKNIRPLLIQHCYECHSADADKIKGGLLLDSREALLVGGDSGPAIVSGKPQESLLISAVKYQSYEMPPNGKLSAKDISLLNDWILAGAAWPKTTALAPRDAPATTDWEAARSKHWAYQKVKRPDLPDVSNKHWVNNPVDYFILAQLDEHRLEPATRADRRTLIRRLYYDMLGIPPTPEQVTDFIQQDDPNAYEQLVDELLSSPKYGEKWGRHWLDVARYNEGFGGFTDNGPNAFAWRYRDWVVRKFNADLPYDNFVRQQIAGDLNGTVETKLGTGFLALGPTFRTDGGDADSAASAKSETLDDRVDTLTRGLLGVTVACARCHDHKFDPIPTLDYYSLAGIFNNSTSHIAPISPQPIVDSFNQAQGEVNRLNNELKKANDVIKKAAGGVTAQQTAHRDTLQLQRDAAQKNVPPKYNEAHVLRDIGSNNMTVALRGDLRKKGPEAPRRFLRIIEGEQAVLYKNGSGRQELAESIVHPDNPLTGRVFVNRLWLHHFGRGLVTTPSNFGILGNKPSHPRLLDWLTSELIRKEWSIKELHYIILTSATYQQSSHHNTNAFSVDGDNKYLWRYPPRRMDVELWRDSLMFATGELDQQLGGPPQNNILQSRRRTVYAASSRNGDQFESDRFLRLFDFATPRASIAKRTTTTIPQQFLFMLNSQFMIERARQFFNRLAIESEDSQTRIERGYALLYNREPTQEELTIGLAFVASPPTQGTDKLDKWIQYCQVLLSSNELMFIR